MRLFLVSIFILISACAFSQGAIRSIGNRLRGIGNAGSSNDTLGKRNKFEDSITISYRYLDTARVYRLDSSLADFSIKYPIPDDYYFLGNTGSAAQSFLFAPNMKPGLDPGFHAYDLYKFTIDKARFFTATRPYSEVSYLLGTRSEQYIELLHTQNLSPNWNVHGLYRLISAPGLYRNQKTSHNSYLLTSWAQSTNKRYKNFITIVANKLKGSENGGIDLSANYIDNPDYAQRFRVPTLIGGDVGFGTNFFNTNITTGNTYEDFNALLRQQYDFGRKDSIVTDSTVLPLFFPRVRFEHSIRYSANKFLYSDNNPVQNYYKQHYNLENLQTPFRREDYWNEIMNDFSIYTFPDEKNTQQFLKVGAALQNIKGVFRDDITETIDNVHYADDKFTKSYNIIGHGEYRNRTKNQKWDMLANGQLFFAGMNAGDYKAAASIQSMLGKKIGSLKLGFENVNRTPAYIIQNSNSAFYLMPNTLNLKKENTIHLYADVYQPLLKLGLGGHYFLVNNYAYYIDYYKVNQASIFNVLQIAAHKVFAAGRKDQFKWISDVYFQQVIGNGPVNLPMVYTRNRLMYEGNLGFQNLKIAMGFDTRYRTNYKANGYSPLLGQFFYQDQTVVKYKLPDVDAFIHFKISSFRAFIRAENLNTFRALPYATGGGRHFGFTNSNFAAPGYPYPGLIIRFGVYWGFVN